MIGCRPASPPIRARVTATRLDIAAAASRPLAAPYAVRGAAYPHLAERDPLRIAFVGQETYFRSCALSTDCGGVAPSFVDYRAGADIGPVLARLELLRPDIVVVFRPEIVPTGAFGRLEAITLGYLTEPLPRADVHAHADLVRRLGYLEAIDPQNFDRIISFDPLMVPSVERLVPVWRSLPLPVADELFAPVPRGPLQARALFIGRSTEHRELFLAPVKHEFDVLHVAHGASDEMLAELLAESDIGINIHNENYPTFENRCATILAAGNLLISERLSPMHGLEPALDFIEVTVPEELHRALFNVCRYPDGYRRIRVRGRMKAEYFRASRVYPRLIGDLLLDVRTFGRGRVPGR